MKKCVDIPNFPCHNGYMLNKHEGNEMRKSAEDMRDIEMCREEIKNVLFKYGCTLMDADEDSYVLLLGLDTGETINALCS